MPVKVIDSIMGSGKTSWACQYMNSHPHKRYMYVTPYLKETERICKACPRLSFKIPTDEISKSVSMQIYIADGENIAMSHELFSRTKLSAKLSDNIHMHGYTLFLDEEMDVVEPVDISPSDTKMLFDQGLITVDEHGAVHWKAKDYSGKFTFIRRMAESKTLIYFEHTLMMWIFPVEILKAFEEIYILTFLFEGSNLKSFLDLNEIPYKMYHVQGEQLMDGKQDLSATKEQIRELLHVYEGPLNEIGNGRTALSKSWYQHQTADSKKQVASRAENYFRHKMHAKANDCIWATFADVKKRAPIRNYSSGFVPLNMRASNDYGDRHYLAYLVNLFAHPYVAKWFAGQGITVNQEAHALAMMMQWIWRSAIRNGETVYLYLPSERMRNLLLQWLGTDVQKKEKRAA